MTSEQIEMAKKLEGVTFLPASFDKRFCRDMATIAKHKPEQELTEKQARLLTFMIYRYRRQIYSNWEKLPKPPGYTSRGSYKPSNEDRDKLS